MSEEVTKARRKGRPAAGTRAKRPAGTAKPQREAGQAKNKTDATVRGLIFMVSRVAAGFEATLKAKEPALSLSQWAMLEMLSQDDGTARPSQIARKLGFSRQLVRQATKKLLSLELVAKETPEEGKKAVGLTLSDAGRTVLTDIATATEAMSASLTSGKHGGGVGPAVRALKRLSAAMPANTESRGKGRKKAKETADAAATEDTVEA